MREFTILVIADTNDQAAYLVDRLLPGAGLNAVQVDAFSDAIPADAILVDVTQLRTAPLSGLQNQRERGNTAPALVCAPRLTGDMANQLFDLNIRAFLRKPLDDGQLVDRLWAFVQQAHHEGSRERVEAQLERAQAALTRRLEELNALSRIGRSITSLTDVDVILTRIVEAAVYLTRADEGAIFLADEATGRLMMRAQQGLEEEAVAIIRQPSSDSSAAVAFNTGEPVIQGGQGQQIKITTDYIVQAAMNMPILAEGATPSGVLAVHSHTQRGFEPADQVVLASLADFTMMALGKAYVLQELDSQIDAALGAARQVRLHAETLLSPADGILSQANTLLSGEHGRLNEAQHSAVSRIKLAADRLREVVGFIEAEFDEFPGEPSAQV
jgi:two-component system NtrC family sensor kinase